MPDQERAFNLAGEKRRRLYAPAAVGVQAFEGRAEVQDDLGMAMGTTR